jgi:hypothetical protein
LARRSSAAKKIPAQGGDKTLNGSSIRRREAAFPYKRRSISRTEA